MADIGIFQTLSINGVRYKIKPCWESILLTKEYMLALLSRDEYTPILKNKPTETDTIYIDPASGNQAGFHPGQCVSYVDAGTGDGFGLSIVKNVVTDSHGTPVKMSIHNATDIEKRVIALETTVNNGCFGNGVWYNTLKWMNDTVWDNGNYDLK